ncbi:uncharacterized protein LOC124950004 isoform X1 [Vespa velutina]|uniref:uncharacterized protein LOC124950004 isoform X1 n=3 Tax=Vespa velutina TaxID=202808 RepID=UPI001FB38D9A|nr:uncharacterized protein LOC124950004 isoform X1 [Vespa velutina]
MNGKLKIKAGKMDEYDKKFAEMQKYIPFLEAMIERLQNVKDKSREIQLQKMQSLHGILSNSKRKLKIETLQRCEDVLQKLHNKVEKFQGNAPGLHVPNKKIGDIASQPTASLDDTEKRNKKKKSADIQVITIQTKMEETPASPTPPVSPETVPQMAPIIIPTERSIEPISEISDKHINLNEMEISHSIKPIIIPIERNCDIGRQSPNSRIGSISNEDTDELTCSEWDMLEESEIQNTKFTRGTWKSVISSNHDVSNAAKLMSNSLPQKMTDSQTTTKTRHIVTVPVPSLGGSRRLSSVLEKNMLTGLNLDIINSNIRTESPVNVPEVLLNSPDPEMLFSKPKNISPRAKDGFSTPKSNSKPPMLVSPPPVSTEPPLSIEDLAELLNEEEGTEEGDKKDDQLKDNSDLKRLGLEKTKEDTLIKKDNNKKISSNTDLSTSKHLLSQDDIDRESDRRWEEVDKHIVKLTTRKCLPNAIQTSSNAKPETLKSNEIKGPPPLLQHNFSLNIDKSIDHRHRSSSPSFKLESRYAESYERHPRQLRDNVNDKILNLHSRLHDEEVGNVHVLHGGPIMQEDRSTMLYQRRAQTPNIGDTSRIDHSVQQEHFNRQSVSQPLWPSHPPSNPNDFCNPQWTSPNNYNGLGNNSMQGMPIPNSMYQHPMGMLQDMWNSGVPNSAPMDSHPINDSPIRPSHFNANIMPGIRPLLSTPHSRVQEVGHDDSPMNPSIIPPLMSPTNFPPQYRGFHDVPFDRPVDYPISRQSWDQPINRSNEPSYRNDPEMNCTDGIMGMPGSYSRPSTPCPWNRDRDRCNRGRGRDGYYNDRCRGEVRNNFTRDGRPRPERLLRDVQIDWDNCNRFNRDSRTSVSDRDPRLRIDHGNTSSLNSNHNRENSSSSSSTSNRDPRLTKDKQSNVNKLKDNAYQERDPRKRSISSSTLSSTSQKVQQKSKSKKVEASKRDSDNSSKQMSDKISKDKKQSPLESLYGVIDTKGKGSQSSGLQKFKIPKIKRLEQSTHSNNSSNEEKKSDSDKNSAEKEDTSAEVTSSSDVPQLKENWDADDVISETVPLKNEDVSAIKGTNIEREASSPTTSIADKDETKFEEPDSIMNTSAATSEIVENAKKDDTEIDGLKLKDGVTQEWIEGLIRKSLEFGEGKKLFEQAKLIQKLGEALEAKKLKKIKKIIESESESSSSDKDEDVEAKRIQVKKKRRVIVSSDSSDEDCLAERLDILTNLSKEKNENKELENKELENKELENKELEKDNNISADNSISIEKNQKNICFESKGFVNTINESDIDNLENSCTTLEKSGIIEVPEFNNDTNNILENSNDNKEIEDKKHDLEKIQKFAEELNVNERYTSIENISVSNNETTEDKESSLKISKPKTKRRNSLEMLQEDIREMFISEGVVSATGHRLCRVLKENQTSTSTITPTSNPSSVSKKSESCKLSNKQNVEIEGEEQISKTKKLPRIRNNEKSGKTKCKNKKEVQRVTRQSSKEQTFSSDSEEDQPLSLRTTNRESNSNKNLDVSKEEDEKYQDAEVLRRSKRVLRKDVPKEARVLIEKTNIAKIDSSKTMFDSSSDESLGIDMSVLTDVIDTSLNMEKQSSHQRSSSQVASPKNKTNIQNFSKKGSKRKRSMLLNIDKIEDTVSVTDEESIISDISMSSSISSAKKVNNNIDKLNNGEELSSDIVVGLVPSKANKDMSQLEKGSDADVDEDVNDLVRIEQGQKKISVKKKKKKFTWQMGILSKKKKKKTSTLVQVESDRIIPEIQHTSEKISIQKDKSDVKEKTKNLVEENIPEKEHTKEPVLPSVNYENNNAAGNVVNSKEDSKKKDSKEKNKEIDCTTSCNVSIESSVKKTILQTENKEISPIKDDKTSTNEDVSLLSTEDSVSSEHETSLNFQIQQLIEYAWTGQERYKCLLCSFHGKSITHHYKLNHPDKEVLISRFQSTEAQMAIEESKNNNYEETCTEFSEKKSYLFNCRICYFSTEGTKDAAIEAFYEHCTTHTGEYRFQCKSCPYQTVTKTSMRTHYYKLCRKYGSVFNEVMIEDPIPNENGIYGYLCSVCNYVQLKRTNLQTHIKTWHSDATDVNIIKINMSTDATDITSPVPITSEKLELKIEKCETSQSEEKQINDEQKNEALISNNCENKITETQVISEEKDQEVSDNKEIECTTNKDLSNIPPKSKEQLTLLEKELTELTVPITISDKLSVFVCPPELEHKEVEIQLERKKKMQEIVENFGIKVHKDVSEKKKSIIDTLKDKMKTNVHKEDSQNKDLILINNVSELGTSNNSVSSTSTTSSESNTKTTESCISNDKTTSKEDILKSDELKKTKEQDNSNTDQNNLNPSSEKADVQDPLVPANIDGKNIESEIETSDNETTRESATVYDSDSSSEQTDTEITTDVNSILKETSNVSSKDPMMTTIQRLAAQLQSIKSRDGCASENSTKVQTNTDDKMSAPASIPKPPNVVPIASIKHFLGKQDKKMYESIKEITGNDDDEPKSFLRFRRLSGDMLSVSNHSSENQEDTVSLSGTGSQSDTPGDILQTDTEEECSFLKIENVVSLAPCTDSIESENTIISDIRKAVETSPIKRKAVSLLKKTAQPLILKRFNSVTIRQPVPNKSAAQESLQLIPVQSLTSTSSHTTNYVPIVPKSKIIQIEHNKLPFQVSVGKNTTIAPVTTHNITGSKSPSLTNLNYKILKVVKTSPLLKAKDLTSQSILTKLKSSDAYTAMLKPQKLSQFYKCMARDCSFTTDSITLYCQHYAQHDMCVNKKKDNSSYDYQKCAYCHTILSDWTQMQQHMEEKHEHCRYQCNCCFYRAIAPSYVQIHQAVSHAGSQAGILLGKLIKELPTKEDYNRHDYIQPFVCQHECGKVFYIPETFISHLKTKHSVTLSIYKCHLCSASCLKIEQLIIHYKIHGIYKYQCLYCLNGADSFSDMLTHLSLFHCNRLPQILERSLPAQAVRTKDVINQLLIRTLDIKTSSEMIDAKNETENKQEKDVEYLSSASTQSLEEISILDEKTNDTTSDKKLVNIFSICSSNESNSSSVKMSPKSYGNNSLDSMHNSNSCKDLLQCEDDISEILTSSQSCVLDKNPPGESLVPKKTIESEKSCTQEGNYHTSKHILHEPELQLLSGVDGDISAVDPLRLTNILDCSDEYVNINVLENPNFVKNVSDNSNLPADSKKSIINENKTDDSDIEILEQIEISKDNTKNKEDKLNQKSDEDIKETLNIDSVENNTKKEQVDVAHSSGEASNGSVSKIHDKSEKPLTLEDIKDTGFTGNQLYKCGYEDCDFNASTAANLRIHLKKCTYKTLDKNLNCTHCGKRFVKIGFLLEHLKLHGLKRFGCSLCKARCTVSYQAMAHMRTKHKIQYSKVIPADPENPSADGLFIVQPLRPTNGERKGKKRKTAKASEKDAEKTGDIEKLTFGPDEIELLPRQAIYNREVQCAVCPYTTKVRTNIIRHLQLHAKDETVPEIGPVNPVPCLDKKERMFDKMVNLASSSHQNGRMGGKPKDSPKDNDESFIPKFVPEHKRYVCSVAECNYLTVDEAMLRYHLKALHSDEQYFRCPHCPQPSSGQEGQNIAIDKMGVHLKMHDTRLYKCSHCNHHHYHRHIIERHLSDKHPEKRPFVKVIRELESTENIQQPAQEEMEEEIPDPDGNHWKCNICEYKCVYKAEMITHASVSHDDKYQFKCTVCSFKTSVKVLLEQHITSKHAGDPNADYIMAYQKIKGVTKKSGDSSEQAGQDEPFDTTPLWRRDMPRVRHIRGILLEDEEVGNETSVKGGKRKSDTDSVSTRPAKIKHGKSVSLDENKHCKEKSKRSLSCEKISIEMNNSNEIENNTSKGTITDNNDTSLETTAKANSSIDVNDFNESDVERFGPYGKPVGNLYICTLCDQYKTKYKHDMRDHLYRELNYARWHCKDCGFLSVNRNALLKHFTKHHNGERPDHAPLSPDNAIENWVGTLLKRQTDIMKGLVLKQDNKDDTNLQSNTKDAILSESTRNKSSVVKTDRDIISKDIEIVKNVNLDKKRIRHDIINRNTNVDINDDDNNDNDDDSDSDKNLVIATNDEDESSQEVADEQTLEANKSKDLLKNDADKPLICKHCKMRFARWRGLKLHVKITHLKRLGFLCPYCDRSTNSESLMRQHIRSKHSGCPEKIINNPDAGGPELSDEFWEKEYGIVSPKKRSRKRRRKANDQLIKDKTDRISHEMQETCNQCGFTAMSYAGLKAHLRIHASKNALKCQQCNFSSSIKAEFREHWELNHSHLPFKITDDMLMEDIESTSDDIKDEKCKKDTEGCNTKDGNCTNNYSSKERRFSCYYCKMQSSSLEILRKHWSLSHQTSTIDELKGTKIDLPFKYKEILVPVSCVKNIDDSDVNMAVQNVNNCKIKGWVCQWCDELCYSESAMKAHQNMFHSHLPFHFKTDNGEELHKIYVCPICSFTTIFINDMRKHASKHINLFKCKHCDKTFNNPTQVEIHNNKEHPQLQVKIESITNYKDMLENIMEKVLWNSMNGTEVKDETKQEKKLLKPKLKNRAVARKSTAKSTIRMRNSPYKVKAVARKSTHPLPRYPSGTNFLINNYKNQDNSNKSTFNQFSFYGIPSKPINLGQLSTYMVVGGHRMKVNCTTLAQLININPHIKLKDIKYDIKYVSIFSRTKQ